MGTTLPRRLQDLGFPEGACCRAAVAVSSGAGGASAEAGMEWLLTHSDDADFADPYVPPAAAAVPVAAAAAPAAAAPLDDGLVSMLMVR